MNTNTIFIVADSFINFAKNDYVITYSQIDLCLRSHFWQPSDQQKFIICQGISDAKIHQIKQLCCERNLEMFFQFPKYKRADSGLSHKHKSHNTMIAKPQKISSNEYNIPIFLDENCAEMSDHLTGQHIQGMVLIEAARQSFLAVTEAFFNKDNIKYYFVINEFNTVYKSFMFPLNAYIKFKITQMDTASALRMMFSVTMDFYQAGSDQSACTIKASYTAYDEQKIHASEEKRARAAVAANREVLQANMLEGCA